MTTLKDIARIANVNVSTVSKALRQNSDLNMQTVTAIRKIADQLHYPYSLDGPDRKREPLIGIVCPEIISSYYTGILDSFQNYVKKAGYETLIMVSGFSDTREAACIKLLMRHNVCGIICLTESSGSTIQGLAEASAVPFLLVTTVGESTFCDSISIDDHHSAMMAVDHLAELGHTKIAYIGDKLSAARREAFLTALGDRNIPVVERYIIETDLRFEECGYDGMRRLLAMQDRPTGVFAAYDNIAIGAMRAIAESGLAVPEDISVVGIDNITTSAYLPRSLTTVTEPTADLGEIASALIIEKIQNKRRAIQNIKLRPTLNIRETTAAAR